MLVLWGPELPCKFNCLRPCSCEEAQISPCGEILWRVSETIEEKAVPPLYSPGAPLSPLLKVQPLCAAAPDWNVRALE